MSSPETPRPNSDLYEGEVFSGAPMDLGDQETTFCRNSGCRILDSCTEVPEKVGEVRSSES